MIYLTLTRPDITYTVNVVSLFMHSPASAHLVVVDRILCYLKKNPGKDIIFTKYDIILLEAYTDAGWAGSIDMKFTTGYCIYLDENLVVWRSKKQTVYVRSSAEAEYWAVAMGITELLWVNILLKNIGIEIDGTMRLYCDNKAAIYLSNNPVLHDRTKYVEIDWHLWKVLF